MHRLKISYALQKEPVDLELVLEIQQNFFLRDKHSIDSPGRHNYNDRFHQ